MTDQTKMFARLANNTLEIDTNPSKYRVTFLTRLQTTLLENILRYPPLMKKYREYFNIFFTNHHLYPYKKEIMYKNC